MFAEVVFPLPFRNSFTYKIPEEFLDAVEMGVRVVVPFGRRILTGFVINVLDDCKVEGRIKNIQDVLDTEPIFNNESLKFYKWISDYYLSSLGEALRNSVPYGTEVETKRKIISDMEYCYDLYESEKKKDSTRGKILRFLSEKETCKLAYLQKVVKKKNIYSILKTLHKNGAITIVDEVEGAKVRVKKVKAVKLNKPLEELYDSIGTIEKRSPKQALILLEMISAKGKEIQLSDLLKKTESSASSVDGLVQKGYLEIFDLEIKRNYLETYDEELKNIILTDQQSKIVTTVNKSIDKDEFKSFLLHGITGSGKTQVYIELAKKVLAKNKTVLILVPEISLTPQMTSRLINNFGDSVAVLHSQMSIGERFDSWRSIVNGESTVVVGARSALFAPLKNLGLIVVDEEHDQSYKQYDMVPKYQARDAGVIRGWMEGCPVLLGSATPSIESMYNALIGKYELLELPERIDDAKLPDIKLVNIKIEQKQKRMENIFSNALLKKIKDRIEKNEGVIILQNRRGFATQVYCEDCGEIEMCKECSVGMVHHISKNILQCHYCGASKPVPKGCTTCGSLNIKFFGTGTQRVEDELDYYLPDVNIERVDSDTINKKGKMGILLNSFRKGEIDVLVGTQMVSKGLDFANVTLVGVISAETSLWMPDFRADERTFQLLTQVSGRAGRSKTKGEVIIQTQDDKHFVLQKVLGNDYKGFYEREIKLREKMGYPPFTRLCLIEAKDPKEGNVIGAMKDLYSLLTKYKSGLKISPPTEAVILKLKGQYRYQILIKSFRKIDPSGSVLRKVVLDSFIEFNKRSRYRDVRVFFDIDPQSVL
ncbi:MAG: primosomal protein N' [Melioribacteraceae bacterium]|nr:primosomal protein N' [Melioribacteraceae bacterium]